MQRYAKEKNIFLIIFFHIKLVSLTSIPTLYFDFIASEYVKVQALFKRKLVSGQSYSMIKNGDR